MSALAGKAHSLTFCPLKENFVRAANSPPSICCHLTNVAALRCANKGALICTSYASRLHGTANRCAQGPANQNGARMQLLKVRPFFPPGCRVTHISRFVARCENRCSVLITRKEIVLNKSSQLSRARYRFKRQLAALSSGERCALYEKNYHFQAPSYANNNNNTIKQQVIW